MTNRFFKLLYVFALIAIGLWLPIYIFSSIDYEDIVWTSYKAKCLSNNQYVVLQGSSANDAYVFDEVYYNDTVFNDLKKDLNFYCKYYDAIQPHIIAYNQTRTTQEQVRANQEFFTFKEGVVGSVSSYPMLYKLEVAKNEFQSYRIYDPISVGFFGALAAFILLQIVRMSYAYVVFGAVVWHPFRSRNKLHDL